MQRHDRETRAGGPPPSFEHAFERAGVPAVPASQADAELIEAAAHWLTSRANLEHFAGWQRPERAYATSSLLSTIALQLADVPESVRHEAVRAARELIGEREAAGRASTRPSGALRPPVLGSDGEPAQELIHMPQQAVSRRWADGDGLGAHRAGGSA